ncbi:hypothetical protein LIS82_07420 [Cytobacillus solani]|uniref:hypothetical protein n=1 Tax=Cytobacillus solani TaxID=1637975 RepID=UPI0006AB9FD7|nr:hypothetical protein [Cytobacillus solani]KOP81501.1 hypothetical protein AMS60_02790 [Bacillus sp. FJAT-21945]USK56297.1 hypothetical protein LIS82_07420 [Cytobacillus solani]
MKRILLYSFIILTFLALFGCNNSSNVEKISIQHLNSDGTIENSFEIDNKEKITNILKILDNIKWEKNTKVEMSRKEDIIITLYYKKEKEVEIKHELRVWFSVKAEIKSSEEGYGKLSEIDAKKLKELVSNN